MPSLFEKADSNIWAVTILHPIAKCLLLQKNSVSLQPMLKLKKESVK